MATLLDREMQTVREQLAFLSETVTGLQDAFDRNSDPESALRDFAASHPCLSAGTGRTPGGVPGAVPSPPRTTFDPKQSDGR